MLNWDFALNFSEKCTSEETIGYIIDCIRRSNLEVHKEEFDGQTLLSIRASFDVLAQKVSREVLLTCCIGIV